MPRYTSTGIAVASHGKQKPKQKEQHSRKDCTQVQPFGKGSPVLWVFPLAEALLWFPLPHLLFIWRSSPQMQGPKVPNCCCLERWHLSLHPSRTDFTNPRWVSFRKKLCSDSEKDLSVGNCPSSGGGGGWGALVAGVWCGWGSTLFILLWHHFSLRLWRRLLWTPSNNSVLAISSYSS